MFRPSSLPRLPLTLFTTLLLTLFILLSTSPTAVTAGEFDIGEVCGKLNGDGYTNQYMCSQDRKSVIICTTPSPTILPTWQHARPCHSDHFCYALQGSAMESKWGNAPMEPNGYPSEDAGSFGCRKLLGLEDQPKGQKVIDGGKGKEDGLRKRGRVRRGVSEGQVEKREEGREVKRDMGEKEEWRRWVG